MLRKQIVRIEKESGATCIAAAFHDYESETSWSLYGDRWFHAASTIKVALLASVFDAIEQGRFTLDSRVHVRNRFLSVAGGEPYRIAPERDANAEVHAKLGNTMKVRSLAHHMIVTSSNFATNLLLDLVGIEQAKETLHRLGVEGMELLRGVEDERAFEAGINNRTTALGLVHLFRLIHERQAFSEQASSQMLEILLQQEFRSGIPSGLPDEVRERAQIAHKTGEISTVTHDAGIVYLPDRKPYVAAILTEWPPEASGRRETVAAVSNAIYHYLIDQDPED